MNWYDLLRQALVVAGGIGAIIFPIYYHRTAPGWRHNEMGRFLMLGGIGWASLYLSGIVAILFPTEVAREIIRFVLTLGAGSFAWYQVWLYRKVRKEEIAFRRDRERRESE
jgi:hypothetical protein